MNLKGWSSELSGENSRLGLTPIHYKTIQTLQVKSKMQNIFLDTFQIL